MMFSRLQVLENSKIEES